MAGGRGRRPGRGNRGGRLGAGGRGGLVGRLDRGGAREQGREAHRGDGAELRGPPGQAGEAAQPGRARGALVAPAGARVDYA